MSRLGEAWKILIQGAYLQRLTVFGLDRRVVMDDSENPLRVVGFHRSPPPYITTKKNLYNRNQYFRRVLFFEKWWFPNHEFAGYMWKFKGVVTLWEIIQRRLTLGDSPHNCLDLGSKAQAISCSRLLKFLKLLLWYLQVTFLRIFFEICQFSEEPQQKSKRFDRVHLANSLGSQSWWMEGEILRTYARFNQQRLPWPWKVDHGGIKFQVPPKKKHTQTLLSWFLVHLKASSWWLASVYLMYHYVPPLETNMTGWKSLTTNRNTSLNWFYFHLQVSRM